MPRRPLIKTVKRATLGTNQAESVCSFDKDGASHSREAHRHCRLLHLINIYCIKGPLVGTLIAGPIWPSIATMYGPYLSRTCCLWLKKTALRWRCLPALKTINLYFFCEEPSAHVLKPFHHRYASANVDFKKIHKNPASSCTPLLKNKTKKNNYSMRRYRLMKVQPQRL